MSFERNIYFLPNASFEYLPNSHRFCHEKINCGYKYILIYVCNCCCTILVYIGGVTVEINAEKGFAYRGTEPDL